MIRYLQSTRYFGQYEDIVAWFSVVQLNMDDGELLICNFHGLNR